jgi:predicted nucleotidyltransferase
MIRKKAVKRKKRRPLAGPSAAAGGRRKFMAMLKAKVPEKVVGELGPLVKEIRLVGSTLKGKKADVDIVIVATKALAEFSEREYYRLLKAEEELTQKHKRNFELFVRLPEEFKRRKGPSMLLWKKK